MPEPEFECSKCGEVVHEIHENGLCSDCETKRREEVLNEYLDEHPDTGSLPPSAQQPGYSRWECHVIPEVCPYCKEEIAKEKVRGKPYYLHFCHKCKIYYGHERK